MASESKEKNIASKIMTRVIVAIVSMAIIGAVVAFFPGLFPDNGINVNVNVNGEDEDEPDSETVDPADEAPAGDEEGSDDFTPPGHTSEHRDREPGSGGGRGNNQ